MSYRTSCGVWYEQPDILESEMMTGQKDKKYHRIISTAATQAISIIGEEPKNVDLDLINA